VLRHDLEAGSEAAQLGSLRGHEVRVLEPHGLRLPGFETQDHLGSRRLAAPRLPHQAEGLPGSMSMSTSSTARTPLP